MVVSDPGYLFILILALGTSSFATVYSWQRKALTGARTFALNSALGVAFVLCTLLLILSPTTEVAFFSLRLRLIVLLLAIATFPLFILEFAGYRRWLSSRRVWIFFAFPLFAIAIVLSSHFGDWVVMGYSLQRQSFILYERYQTGPIFTLSQLYAFSLYLILLIILGFQSVQVHPPFRWQVLILFVITAFTTFITIPSIAPAGQSDLLTVSPFVLQIIFRSVLVTWALFSFRFLNILPIASNGIIAGLRSAVIVLDSQRRVVTMNPSALTLAGCGLTPAVGQNVQEIFSPLGDMIARYNGTDEVIEKITVKCQGRSRIFECRLYPLENVGKHRVGHLLWLDDVTQRSEAESEREQLIDDLDAYAHTVAHDLKNPLALVRGYCELALDSESPATEAERLQYLGTIRTASFKMQTIIEELLLLSSVRTQSNIPITPLDMQPVVQEAVRRMEPLIKDSGANVTVQCEWPVARGYMSWIEQVWVNYLSNAIKYGGTPPEIEIGAESQGERVKFWIRDNGRGLNSEQQSRLFKEFSRLSQAGKDGHGIGLSIVRRIIEKLGGEVGVNSETGKGSTFYFVLPAANTP